MPFSPLPIDDVLPELAQALERHAAVVLQAAPGAGKTTRVPGKILDYFDPEGLILVLEPRRVAATASAERVAYERESVLGHEVGIRIRHFKKESKNTRILFVTEGILTRWILRDPFLEGVSFVILDEFHERNLHSDLCLAFLKELLELRDDLKIVVMSATLEASRLSAYLGGAPVVKSEGRAFELKIEYSVLQRDARLPEECVAATRRMMLSDDDDGGDVLVFLPGRGEIQKALELCERRVLPHQAEVLPLYAGLTREEQNRVLQKKSNRRRVIFSTNIAETSLTLEGVSCVVDSGYERRLENDPARGINALLLRRISKSSATQRAGRAGRTRAGRVTRLWGKAEHAQLHAEIEPELLRVDITEVALWCLGFAARPPEELSLLDSIPKAKLARALETLSALKVYDEEYRLTKMGKALLEMPLHPRVGVCLLAAKGTVVENKMIALVSLLDEEDVLVRQDENAPTVDCDLSYRLQLEKERPQMLKRHILERSLKARRQLARQLFAPQHRTTKNEPSFFGENWKENVSKSKLPLGLVLLQGFSDRMCRRRAPESLEAQMSTGQGVVLHATSQVRDAKYFIALNLQGRGAKPVVNMASRVSEEDLEQCFLQDFVEKEEAFFDDERQAVIGVRRKRFRKMLLSEKVGIKINDDEAHQALLQAMLANPKKALYLDEETQQVEARMRFAAMHLNFEEEEVLLKKEGLIDEERVRLLEESLYGLRSFSQVKKINMGEIWLQKLPYYLRKKLDDEVPARILVPSGSKVKIDYRAAFGPEGVPLLAVRLQEVFGMTQTPMVAGVPLLLHLLAPNRRPAAITSDLVSFWNGAYVEVRKELKRRYPRHSWPENPIKAAAEHRPQRRRTPR